jgi:hypothetical protein
VDARRSPSWILGHHAKDQFPNFLRSLPSPNRPSHFGNQLPIQPEASPMPSDYRFRVDHDKRLFPPDQSLRAKTQNSLSNNASLGLGRLRFNAASCWRSAKFSRRSL